MADDDDSDSSEDFPTEALTVVSASQTHYVGKQNDKKILVVMLLGQGREFEINAEEEPWSFLPKHELCPRQTELSQEVNRRSISLDIKPQPCPCYWLATQSTEWLRGHPITRQDDVEWLKAERGHLARIIQVSQMEANEMEQLGFIADQWHGNIPMLHLFHCIIEDDIKPLFLCCNDACTRRELDQQNSSERPETAYEVIAKRWNNVDFNPTILVMLSNHDTTSIWKQKIIGTRKHKSEAVAKISHEHVAKDSDGSTKDVSMKNIQGTTLHATSGDEGSVDSDDA